MIDMSTVTAFLGWCTLINMSLLIFVTVWLVLFRDWTRRIHSALLGVDPARLDVLYFQYLAHYKLAVLVLNLVPYVVLKFLL